MYKRELGSVGAALLVMATAGCTHVSTGPVATIETPSETASGPDTSLPPETGDVRRFAGIEMVYIAPGTFTMGSPKGEPQRDPEDEVPRTVTIDSGFWISKHEITQAEWSAVLGSNPSEFRGADRPVENVSWEDCQEFVKRLNERSDGEFRLPKEAEWEYACRAGTTTPFHFGDSISANLANYDASIRYNGGVKGTGRDATVSVGRYPENPWGLHDMHGNVWEWCEDIYGIAGARTDPRKSVLRTIRGGGWLSEPMSCRSAYRYAFDERSRHDFIGLRLVRDE